ncbi:MAG: lamin tail domain-containing protein [Methanotrichaceae archaeon]
MRSSGGYLRKLLILSVLFGLPLEAAIAANAPASAGINIAKIIGVNCQDADPWVEIANEGTGSMNLAGWTLMNTENQAYSFPANFTLKTGSIVKVHSGKGDNTAADLFNSTLVWNDKGDTATLKDATGKIVSEYKYPIKVSAPESMTRTNPTILPNTFYTGWTSSNFRAGNKSDYGAEGDSLMSASPVQLSGRSFICHGGPLNWAWTSGLR